MSSVTLLHISRNDWIEAKETNKGKDDEAHRLERVSFDGLVNLLLHATYDHQLPTT